LDFAFSVRSEGWNAPFDWAISLDYILEFCHTVSHGFVATLDPARGHSS
jgi:hypothetical protein